MLTHPNVSKPLYAPNSPPPALFNLLILNVPSGGANVPNSQQQIQKKMLESALGGWIDKDRHLHQKRPVPNYDLPYDYPISELAETPRRTRHTGYNERAGAGRHEEEDAEDEEEDMVMVGHGQHQDRHLNCKIKVNFCQGTKFTKTLIYSESKKTMNESL